MQIVTTHKNTDFDALASIIAATMIYPGSVGVIPTSVNTNVARFLSTHKTAFNIVLPHEIDHQDVRRLIVVDTDQWRRLERMEPLRQRNDVEILLWDHHQNGGDIEASWRCQEPVGATVTLLRRHRTPELSVNQSGGRSGSRLSAGQRCRSERRLGLSQSPVRGGTPRYPVHHDARYRTVRGSS
jgi:hypothetical protein